MVKGLDVDLVTGSQSWSWPPEPPDLSELHHDIPGDLPLAKGDFPPLHMVLVCTLH